MGWTDNPERRRDACDSRLPKRRDACDSRLPKNFCKKNFKKIE